MKKRDFRDYLQDIVDSIQETTDFVRGMTFDAFKKDKKTVNAVLRSIEVLGEATKNLPESVRSQYPEVPWRKMAGMRDKLIHEYSGVDLEIVWQAIQKEFPTLRPMILQTLQDLEKKG